MCPRDVSQMERVLRRIAYQKVFTTRHTPWLGQSSMDEAVVANEITDLNIGYVLLAQKLLRLDRPAAMLRLGIDGEVADFVATLTPSQILTLSSTNALLCGLRLGELLPAVTRTGHDALAQQAHLFIVLASRHGTPSKEIPA
jgi:flagellar transcriptional activator FlhD